MTSKFLFIQQVVQITRYGLSSKVFAAVVLGFLTSISSELGLRSAIAQPASSEQSIEFSNPTPKSSLTTLYVDSTNGDDSKADGSQLAPFKTINRALESAPSNSVIQLAPGLYSPETGETFPISLKPRVTIQGNSATKGQEVIIRGGGFFSSPSLGRQNITVLGGANQAGLTGVTITNPNPNGYGIHIESSSPVISDNTFTSSEGGILLSGSSASLIQNNFFYENRSYGVRAHGTSYPSIKGNLFEQSGIAVHANDNTAPLIVGNRITQSRSGIVAQGRSQPQLRENFIEGNEEYGLLALEQAKPDYSSPAEENNNSFRNNGKKNISIQSVEASSIAKANVDQASPIQSVSRTTATSPNVDNSSLPLELPSSQEKKTTQTRPVGPTVMVQPAREPLQNSAPSASTSSPLVEGQLATKAFPTPELPTKQSPQIQQTSTPNTTRAATKFHSQAAGNSAIAPVKRSNEVTSAAFPTPVPMSSRTQKSSRRQVLVVPVETLRQQTSPQSSLNGGALPQRSTALPTTQTNVIVPIQSSSSDGISQKQVEEVIPDPPASRSPAKSPLGSFEPQQNLGVSLPVIAVSSKARGQKSLPPRPTITPAPNADNRGFLPSSQVVTSARRSIPIPVPLPARNTVPPSVTPQARQVFSNQDSSLLKNDFSGETVTKRTTLLPVPGPDIPVGNIGNMPSVYAKGKEAQSVRFSSSDIVTSARYRVVVLINSDSQQEQVRAIAPDSFPTTYRGQRAIQVGAFGDSSKATQLAMLFLNQGLQANIEPLK